MDIERRALYTALRLSWLSDPSIQVEPWQVENYREMSLPLIFSRIKHIGYHLDKESFNALAESYESPEDLVDELTADDEIEPKKEDQLYLLLFELWRRFEKEKPSLSIFCEELDHQIHLYDQGALKSFEEIQDLFSKLQLILEENSEEGADPESILQMIGHGCANDIEGFLYDFVAEQIESGNYSYAQDLLDSFSDYTSDKKWFDLLRVRLIANTEPRQAPSALESLSESALESTDLEFCLEVLSESIYEGDKDLFLQLVKHCIPLLQCEEDLQDLVSTCIEFLRLLDKDAEKEVLESAIKSRATIPDAQPFSAKDPITKILIETLS